jgi:NhaA family Na+:H+ antiporter
MSKTRMRQDDDRPQLPGELIDWLKRPVARFLRIEAAAGSILLLFTVVALLVSNSPWGNAFLAMWEIPVGIGIGELEFSRSIREWINDALMTLFFFLVALELKRELVLGELRKPRTAALSIVAALGGMLVPAAIYWSLQSGEAGQHGWGTVMATDTAFVIGCLALLGKRIPQSLRVFMLSVAIVDDIGAIVVVAIGYGSGIHWPALLAAAAGVVIVRMMTLLGIRGLVIYFSVGGCIWFMVDASGIHATITGVILGLMTPTNRWVSGKRLHDILQRVVAHPPDNSSGGNADTRRSLHIAEAAAREGLSPVERLEILLHPWVGLVIMPLFALANAGVQISIDGFNNPVTLAVIAGFVLGKPGGIVTFSWFAIRTGIAKRPRDLHWRLIAGGGLLAGIGFTMALFIANLAFSPSLLDSAKLGILVASIVSALAGVLLLGVWSVGTTNGQKAVNHE